MTTDNRRDRRPLRALRDSEIPSRRSGPRIPGRLSLDRFWAAVDGTPLPSPKEDI